MSSETMVFGISARRSEKWRVYRIGTANSTYELEVQDGPGKTARRCVVLTCVAPAARAGESFEDSSPQADEQSLYALSPMDWIGRSLTVGTARTSPVQSVEFVTATDLPPSQTRAPAGRSATAVHFGTRPLPRQAPKAEERPTWAPFPLGYVEMAEAAASLLKAACHRHDLLPALEGEPLLEQRMSLALDQCALLLKALRGRG